MRTQWAFALFLVLGLGNGPLVLAQSDDAPFRAHPKTIVLDRLVETRFVSESAPPTIEVMINLKGPFRLAVDTGAQAVLLDDDVAAQLGSGAPRDVNIILPGAEKPTRERAVAVGSIVIGEAVFSDFEAIVIDYDKVYGGKRQRDGTIGFSLFHSCLFTVDYPRGVVRLEKGELPMENDRDILPYMEVKGVPTVEAAMQLMPDRYTIDTGRAGAVALPEWTKEKIKLRYVDEAILVSEINPRVEDVREVQANGTFVVGHYRLVEPPVYFFGNEFAIGHRALSHFVLTFDPKNERVRFGRADNTPIDFLPPPKLGLYIRREGKKLRVLRVVPGSPAARFNILAGDEVLNVEGKEASQYSELALRNLLETSDSVAMQLSRDGYAYILRLKADDK